MRGVAGGRDSRRANMSIVQKKIRPRSVTLVIVCGIFLHQTIGIAAEFERIELH